MTVEEAVCSRLEDVSALTALVSTRISLGILPEHASYPCVLVRVISDIEGQHLRGREGIPAARVQVDALSAGSGDDYSTAAAVMSAIDGDGNGSSASGLFGWIGIAGSPGIRFVNVSAGPRTFRYDPDERRIVIISRDFFVQYER